MNEVDELRALMEGARALLEWETELGGGGLSPDHLKPAAPSASPTPSASATSEAGAPVSADATSPDATPEPLPKPVARPPRDASIDAPAAPPSPSPATPSSESPVITLEVLQAQAASCTDCRLHAGRTKSVFARGHAGARVAFVGEGPGYHEDQSGQPFVGKAGQLLDKMIAAMGLAEHEVYICNVVKCRPPDNRTPKPDEAKACARFLHPQLELVAPEVVVALGRAATEGLGLAQPGQSGWRGRWGEWRGVAAIATYHPAYLLRSPERKRPVWQDLQAVMRRLGRPVKRS